MKRLVPNWIREARLPITITVIGAGGTGSLFLTHLARIAYAMHKVYNKRLMVTVCDGDTVSESNVGRQAFFDSDVFSNKARTAVARINRAYNTEWVAVTNYFKYPAKPKIKETLETIGANFIISCVDSLSVRKDIDRFIRDAYRTKSDPEWMPMFWMDIGNTKKTGNIIVGSPVNEWPSVIKAYGSRMVEEDKGPSCSLAMALNEQDLFINSFCANIAAKWLWECLSQESISWRGAFVNLDTLQMQKLIVDESESGN